MKNMDTINNETIASTGEDCLENEQMIGEINSDAKQIGKQPTLGSAIKEINKETKLDHRWLNTDQSTSDATEPDESPHNIDPNVGWGTMNRSGNLTCTLNINEKINRWIRKHDEINIRVFRLHKPAARGATHKCDCTGRSSEPSAMFDRSKRILSVLNGSTNMDDFSFNISWKIMAGYTYQAYDKEWIKLIVKVKNNSIEIAFG